MDTLDRPRRLLGAAIAALAGYVDAVGFLSADRYFVSFMSGNTTRLATDLVLHPPRAAIPALLIAGFVGGVAISQALSLRLEAGPWRRWREPLVLALVTGLLTMGLVSAHLGFIAATMALMVLAMGALNAVLRDGESPVALTYLTGALVRIGQALGRVLAGRPAGNPGIYAVLWLSLASGAALGALTFAMIGRDALTLAVAGAAALTALSCTVVRLTSRS